MGNHKMLIQRALEFMMHYHQDQFDRDGNPHALHSIRVAGRGYDDDEIIVGLLHDVIEDAKYPSEATLAIEANFPPHIYDAVRLLTHNEKDVYSEYIDDLVMSRNTLALRVKLNDLDDNISRTATDTQVPARYLIAQSRILIALREPTNNSWLDYERPISISTEALVGEYSVSEPFLDGPAPVSSLKRCRES